MNTKASVGQKRGVVIDIVKEFMISVRIVNWTKIILTYQKSFQFHDTDDNNIYRHKIHLKRDRDQLRFKISLITGLQGLVHYLHLTHIVAWFLI